MRRPEPRLAAPQRPPTKRAWASQPLRSCFKTACRTDAAGSTGRVVTEIPFRSSGPLAGPARCWPPEAMSVREPGNTFRVPARTGCGGPSSSSERVPCDSHGLERGARDAGFRNWAPAVGHGSLNGSASGGASDPAGPGSAGTSGCATTAFLPGTPPGAGSGGRTRF